MPGDPAGSPDHHPDTDLNSDIDPDQIGTRQEFASALARSRERAGLTVRDLARATGVPYSTLGGYFSGRYLPPASQPQVLPAVLRACGVVNQDGQDGEDRVRRWQEALRRVRRAPGPRPADAPAPYPGLASFQPEDAEWFFGRRELTRTVVAMLATATGPLVVVGPSGSGKSSLLRAGVVPAVRDGSEVVLLTPGPHPLSALAAALGAGDGFASELRTDPYRIVEYGARTSAGRQLVIVVDQLEEVFTECRDDDERQVFLSCLAAVTAAGVDRARPAKVLFGLRADFYHRALQEPRLVPALQRAQVPVGPMSEEELREAIVEPARHARLDIEDGLVDVLLRDLAPPASPEPYEAGALPLLAHALRATWERSSRGRLTLADYHATGGLRGAVASTADAVVDSMSAPDQELARRLLVRLVRVGQETPNTRHRVPAGEVDRLLGDRPEVLDPLVQHRLVTVDAEAVEITHEALVSAWPRLRSWVDADRRALLVGQQLEDAARQWLREHRDPGMLYRGARLAAAQEISQELAGPAREFLQASMHRERRRLRALYQTIAALAALLLLAAGGGVVAVQQRARALAQEEAATAERNRAISRLVAGRAERIRVEDVSVAAQLSLAAHQIWPTAEARAALLDSSATPTATRLLGSTGVMQSVALSPDRTLLAAGTADQTVLLWDLTTDPPHRYEPLAGPAGVVFAVAFSPDGRTLAAGAGDGRVYQWDITSDSPMQSRSLAGPEGIVYSVAFSPDGRTLAAGSADQLVHRWDLTDPGRPEALPPLAGAGSFVQSVAFSPDGEVLAAGSDDTTVRLWDLRDPSDPERLATLRGPGRVVFSVAFSPDGRTLAAGSRDGNAYLWNLTDPAKPRPLGDPLAGASGWVQSVAFSPDGETLAAGSSGQVWLWDWRAGAVAARLPHTGPVTSLVYGDDAGTLVSGAADGTARLWHLPGPQLFGDEVTINNVRFSPDGRLLAVASGETRLWRVADRHPVSTVTNPAGYSSAVAVTGSSLIVSDREGRLHTWDTTDPGQPVPVSSVAAHSALIEQIALSPDGTLLATGADDDLVRLWDLTGAEPRQVAELASFDAYVYSVVFSPDGALAAAGVDNTVRVWDVRDPARAAELAGPLTSSDHYALAVAFSPDGTTLAVGSADQNVYLWDLTDPRQPTRLGPPLVGPGNYVYALAYHPEGELLAAASTDGTVWLWDVTDPSAPAVFATLAAGQGALYTVAFSPDGALLAAGGAGNLTWLWQTDVDLIAGHICRTAGDLLTPAEWEKYVPDLPYQSPCPAS